MSPQVPSRSDPLVATLSEVLGGSLGHRAGHHPWWSPQRVALATTAVVLGAGMAAKSACVPSAWTREHQPYSELCWTELAGKAASEGTGPRPAAYVEGLAERIGGLLPSGPGTLQTLVVLALLGACLALLATLLLSRTDPARPWAAAAWAASPVLATQWLSWELIAGFGVALALWGWAQGRLAAIAIGGFLLAAFGHPIITSGEPDVGSLWLLLEQAGWWAPGRGVRLAVLSAAVALAGVAAYAVARRSTASGLVTTARAGLVVAVAVLVFAPSAPPEAALILLPLAALAVHSWRDLIAWQACEVVSWAITGWYLGGDLAPVLGGDPRAYWVAVIVRFSGLAWLAAAALRGGSVDGDDVERGRGEPDPHVDVLADGRDSGPLGEEEHRGLHVGRLGEEPLLAVDRER